MFKLVEIAKAWIAAENPTPKQKLIAEHRANICDSCSSKSYNKAIDLYFCGECGCPLSKKIFSPLPGPEACPKQYWNK